MHPELTLQAVQLRHVELTGRRTHRAASPRRGWFARRRRDTPDAASVEQAPIVLLPPPRVEYEAAGRDRRVA